MIIHLDFIPFLAETYQGDFVKSSTGITLIPTENVYSEMTGLLSSIVRPGQGEVVSFVQLILIEEIGQVVQVELVTVDFQCLHLGII